MQKSLEKFKEDYEKTKKDFDVERVQMQKTLTDQNREIEKEKAGKNLLSLHTDFFYFQGLRFLLTMQEKYPKNNRLPFSMMSN